jgi:vanillate O-demethylase monooxygenase subunit
VRLTKWVMATEPPAYSAKYSDYPKDAKVDRWMYYDFLAPGILLMDSGMMPAGTGGQDVHRDRALAFRGCQALTPETGTSTHYFFGHPHNFLIDRPEVTDEIHAGLLQAFEEDRVMISAQQRNLAAVRDFTMVPFAMDLALTQFRRVIDEMIAAETTPSISSPD